MGTITVRKLLPPVPRSEEVQVTYTPFGELKPGDEYVRLGNYPVLLKDMPGHKYATGLWMHTLEGMGGQCLRIYVLDEYLQEHYVDNSLEEER